jgi:hypothetical protein
LPPVTVTASAPAIEKKNAAAEKAIASFIFILRFPKLIGFLL